MNIVASRLQESMHSQKHVTGLTHNFYKYPARFSPELAHEVIAQFSNPNEWVFDPFMGGGTSVVEALSMGRLALGVDINSLAWFVTSVKTTPLSLRDNQLIREWVFRASKFGNKNQDQYKFHLEDVNNIPAPLTKYIKTLQAKTKLLDYPRLESFARCLILRVCQRLIDSRDTLPGSSDIERELIVEVDKMLSSLENFVDTCRESNVFKNQISSRRVLLQNSTVGIETDKQLKNLIKRPRLVFTSPPYPGVHVLYHRWQVSGRRETSIPYLICDLPNGRTESFYTFGGRRSDESSVYFDLVLKAFKSISKIIHKEAIVVQLVGFSETETQMPLFLSAMEHAGYEEIFPVTATRDYLWREVPNRKWYAGNQNHWDTSKEVLIFHRIKK